MPQGDNPLCDAFTEALKARHEIVTDFFLMYLAHHADEIEANPALIDKITLIERPTPDGIGKMFYFEMRQD